MCPESEVLGEVLNPAVTHENGHQIVQRGGTFHVPKPSLAHWGRDREDANQKT